MATLVGLVNGLRKGYSIGIFKFTFNFVTPKWCLLELSTLFQEEGEIGGINYCVLITALFLFSNSLHTSSK